MNLYNAEKQLKENLTLFGDPKTQPEKYNLYAGLLNLIRGLRDIDRKIDDLGNRIAEMERKNRV